MKFRLNAATDGSPMVALVYVDARLGRIDLLAEGTVVSDVARATILDAQPQPFPDARRWPAAPPLARLGLNASHELARFDGLDATSYLEFSGWAALSSDEGGDLAAIYGAKVTPIDGP
jgi:hypothetical protein